MTFEARPTTPGIVVLGVVLALLIPPVGALLCYLGLGEAKRRGEGVGLARAGLVVGILFTLAALIAVATGLLPGFLRRVEIETKPAASRQNEKPNEKWTRYRFEAAKSSPGLYAASSLTGPTGV
jgi:hypothetical protein